MTLTPTDAKRAIYVDFEGYRDHAPALIGILVEDEFEIVVLDEALQSAAAAKACRTTDGAVALRELAERARAEGRRICAFGNHERDAAREYFDVDLEDIYVNGHRLVKAWWRHTRPGQRPPRRSHRRRRWQPLGRWTLEFFERGLGLHRSRHLRAGHATSRLRHVRAQLQPRGSFDRLTPTAKSKWTKLLRYNETDVRNLRAMVCAAAG